MDPERVLLTEGAREGYSISLREREKRSKGGPSER